MRRVDFSKVNVGTIGHVDYGQGCKVSAICMGHVTGAGIRKSLAIPNTKRSKGDKKGGRKTRWNK